MDSEIVMKLINNVVLLLVLSVIYEISSAIPVKYKKITTVINGAIIGIIGIIIMMTPFEAAEGIVIDTRSILIGATALIFGLVPTLIAAAATAIYRIIIGGVGMYAGLATIVSCAAIGLLWRRFLMPKSGRTLKWLNLYAFGLVTHIAMLLCQFLLLGENAMHVLRDIGLPVMIIYPICTVLLCALLFLQRQRKDVLINIIDMEQRYKSLFDDNLAVMLIIDPVDGSIVDANPAASSFYGWDVQTLRTMNIAQINITPAEQLKADMSRAASQKGNHFLFKHKKASGEMFDIEVYTSPVKMMNKIVLYSIIHDISERIVADKALQESEYRFRMLVECAPDAIFIQTDRRFAFVNKAALDLFGASSPDDLIGTLISDRVHSDSYDAVMQRIHKVNVEKIPAPPMEQIYLKLDSTPVNVDVSAVPIEYRGKSGAIVFVRDITQRKQLEIAKMGMEAQLRQQQKLEAIGTLAGGVAHEINNPINGIMNYAQLILDAIDNNTSNAGYVREIIHETERVSGIVKNLLQFSRQDKQSHSYAKVEDIINQTISLIRMIIKKDQIDLKVVMQENLPDIKCRSQQIQQVLMNLLTNARDALNEKYPDNDENKVIQIFCRQFTYESRKWIRITVEDHGNGISKELQEKIFEPFFSTKPKDKGTGLGLAISFGIVKDHHGSLAIETKEGEYTRFNLDLPVDNGWTI